MTIDLDPQHVETCARCDERPTPTLSEKSYTRGQWHDPQTMRLTCPCGATTHWYSTERLALVYWNDRQKKLKKKEGPLRGP